MGSGYFPGSANTNLAGDEGDPQSERGQEQEQVGRLHFSYEQIGFKPPPLPDDETSALWRTRVQDFDVLLIQGIQFQVLPAHFYEKHDEDEEADEKKKRAQNKADEEHEGDEEEEEEEEEDDDEAMERDPEHDMYPYIDLTSAHVVLDRPWVFDSVEDLPCFRAVPSVFFMRPLLAVGNAVLGAFVPQKSIALAAITLHKLAAFNVYLASLFDDESETGAWLRDAAKQLEAQRDQVLRASRHMVEMNYDFSLRRRLSRSITRQLKQSHTLIQALQRMLERAVGDPQAAAMSWEVWEQSKKKVEVQVFWQTPPRGRGMDPEMELLGSVEVDLQAPVLILREYLQRAFRHRLNELQGDDFQFRKQLDDGSDVDLEREREMVTYSADFVPFKMNNKTMEGAYQLTIVPAPLENGNPGTLIHAFKIHGGKKKAKRDQIVPD